MAYHSKHDGSTFDRPEDAANYDYYKYEMRTRRFRVAYDVDIEWREDDPEFAERTLRVLLNTTDARDAVLVSVVPLLVSRRSS